LSFAFFKLIKKKRLFELISKFKQSNRTGFMSKKAVLSVYSSIHYWINKVESVTAAIALL